MTSFCDTNRMKFKNQLTSVFELSVLLKFSAYKNNNKRNQFNFEILNASKKNNCFFFCFAGTTNIVIKLKRTNKAKKQRNRCAFAVCVIFILLYFVIFTLNIHLACARELTKTFYLTVHTQLYKQCFLLIAFHEIFSEIVIQFVGKERSRNESITSSTSDLNFNFFWFYFIVVCCCRFYLLHLTHSQNWKRIWNLKRT